MKRAVIKLLQSLGLHNSYRYYSRLAGLRPFDIRFLVVSVGQACNYKCRYCGNFAPYAPAEFMRYKLEDITNPLDRIFRSVDSIRKIQIQGGEPFLYSDLGSLIKFISKNTYRGGGIIDIATNGSVLPDDNLLEIIKTSNVIIRISDYNVTPDRTKKLIAALRERGIDYSVYEFAGKVGKWYYKGEVDAKTYPQTDDRTAKQRYRTCDYKGCLTLERGQLSRCSRGNNAPRIQGFTEGKSDYFRLSDFSDKDLRRELMKYYMFPRFMEACRYCMGSDPDKMIEAAEQL